MTDEAPNVDDIRDTVITQIVEGGYVNEASTQMSDDIPFGN